MPEKFIRGEVNVKIETVPVQNLKLDPDNVRFKHLEQHLTDAQIETFIWEESDTRDLLKSIRVSGGLMERPVVSSDYVVKEGNRRVVCLRKLKGLAHYGKVTEWPQEQFDDVECEFLPKEISPIDVDIYLARVHVKGKKPWHRLNQAKHIHELYENLAQSYDAISDYLGIGKRTAQILNWAFAATTQHLQKYGDRAKVTDFVFFDQLYRRKDLREWVEKDPKNLLTFGEWVAAGKIEDPSRELKWLSEILKNDAALKCLEAEDMPRAKQVLERWNPALTSKTFSILQKAVDVLTEMPRKEYLALHEDGVRLEVLKKLRKELDDIIRESEIQMKL